MEIKFENKYIRDRALIKEFFAYFSFRKPSSLAVNCILAPLLFIFSLCMLIFLPYPIYEKNIYILTLFIAAIVVFLNISLYFKNVKIFFRRELEAGGSELCEVNVIVTEENLTLSALKSESTVEFSNIKKLILTKNLIILSTKTNLNFILKADSFTLGTKLEFLEFMRRKGFKI